MVLGYEESTLTHIWTALGLESHWRGLEHCAAVACQTLRLLAQERPARWDRYHPVVRADATRQRTNAKVGGPCTVHEARARSPTRAETVRAPKGVVRGDWRPGTPWT
jgi:hypothetical protein